MIDANGNLIPDAPIGVGSPPPPVPQAPPGTGSVIGQTINSALPVAGIVNGAADLLQQAQPAIRGLAGTGSPQGVPSNSNAEDTPYPGTPGQMGANTDALDGVRDEMLLRMALTNDNDAKAPGPFYAPAHEEYSQLGGRRGKELFNRAYGDGPDDGPTKLASAVEASAQAQNARAKELSASYDKEADRATQAMAARKMATQADQQELMQRQQNLQLASQQYTNDLADTGKFWTNPGNIVAAISFSLMPIFSNDPTVGVKLVNQAIQQDLDNRRQNAQGALGALRSNLDGYSKLAGDRQAGELLMEAEARRVAALDVERIMAKFESPISKARGEALVQDLNIKTAQGYMQAYNQSKVFSQAAKQDPELYKLRTQGYPGAWQGMNDVAPIQPAGAAVNGSVGGSPSLASGQGFTPHVPPSVQMVIKAGAPASVAAKLAMENRIPGSANMYSLLSTYVNREAVNVAKGGGPQAVTAAKQKIVEDASKEIAAVPGLTTGGTTSIAGRKATLADLQASAEVIRASESAHGRDPDAFLGSMRAIVGDSIANKYDQLQRTFQSRDGLSPAAARQRTRDQAVMDFRQKLSMQISSAYNDISGGAISATELPRLEASISGADNFGFAYSWLQTKSKDIQDKEKQATVGLSPIAKILYLTRTGVGQRPSGLPIRPTAGPAKPQEGQGEVNYDSSVSSSGVRPYSGTIGGKPGSEH